MFSEKVIAVVNYILYLYEYSNDACVGFYLSKVFKMCINSCNLEEESIIIKKTRAKTRKTIQISK